jgi:hypothetical protein
VKKRNLPIIILLVLAVVFALGLLELFKLRFESGDVYPPYSTLRADPLGASAFYESLGRMPGISVSRDFRPTDQLPESRGTAYLHLAGSREEWDELPEASFKEIETFVKTGGRLVIAFFPEPAKSHFSRPIPKDTGSTNKPDEKNKDPQKPESKPVKPPKAKKKIKGETEPLFRSVSLAERWGIGFDIKDMKKGDGETYKPLTVENKNEPSLPESMPWHSGVVMTNLDKAWRVIYAREAAPVLVERRLGSGTVVFSTDSYFLSNEAMEKDRHAELLAWVVGPARQVMFDEAHLGIVDDPGIAGLVRKYRLHGVVAGLLLLAGLFIWKNLTGFGPAHDEEETVAFVAGKDSAAGFVNLLRHHVKPQDILNTCVAEWKKSQPQGTFSKARIERVEAVMRQENALAPKDRNAVQTYLTICALLKKGAQLPAANPQPPVNPQKT